VSLPTITIICRLLLFSYRKNFLCPIKEKAGMKQGKEGRKYNDLKLLVLLSIIP
jgi:hypothetical protein